MINTFRSSLLTLRKRKNSEEGFTLIELMIVVVIIGILAAIAIPIFMNQQKEALLASTKSDLKNANVAVANYLAKNNGKLPMTCTEMTDLFQTIPQSPGNEIRYAYSRTQPGVYYVRASPKEDFFLNNAKTDTADEYRMFFLSEYGKTFTSKQAMSSFMATKGTDVRSWLDYNNFGSVARDKDGNMLGCVNSGTDE